MALRDELEQALRATWSTAELSVYADHLQALGDPRGELIALDLAPRDDEAWRARRRALLEAWLGPALAARAGRLVQHGVVHELRDGLDAAVVLDGPIGDVVRGFSTYGGGYHGTPAETVLDALERLAARPRPWLTRLAIDQRGHLRCDPALRDRLIAATPNLTELYTLGERMFDSFHHPSLRRLYVSPADQRARPAVPDTSARGIEVEHSGYPTRSFAKHHDLVAALTFLEAIELVADCNELYASYGDLAPPHDSLPAILMRLDEAGLVRLDGPFARPTSAGRGLLQPPAVRDRTLDAGETYGKWVLWAADSPARSSEGQHIVADLLSRHCRLLATCAERLPIDAAAIDVLREYRDFLSDVVDADEWKDVKLTLELPPLARVLRTLVTFHRLTDYYIERFADVGDDRAWSNLEGLVRFLESLEATSVQPLFRVAWGF
jgi:hypothetical protein